MMLLSGKSIDWLLDGMDILVTCRLAALIRFDMPSEAFPKSSGIPSTAAF